MKIIQPRPFNPRKTLTVLAVLAVAIYFYYQRDPPFRFWKISGASWSAYSVKFLDQHMPNEAVGELKVEIDRKLDEINHQMSTYIPDSEINLFNQLQDTEPHVASTGFAFLVQHALDLCRETGGAFNPTLDHLINLWGFGPNGPQNQPPVNEIDTALSYVGCDKIETLSEHRIRKVIPQAMLNLNAIAEGWAVDEVARYIASLQVV